MFPSSWSLVLFLLVLVQLSLANTDSSDEDSPWVDIPTISGEFIKMNRTEVEMQQIGLPEISIDLSSVKFIFYNRAVKSGQKYIGIDHHLGNLEFLSEAIFNSALPTRILIHGWRCDGNLPFILNLRDEYLLRWNYNVIVVDWSVCAKSINYITSRNCVKGAGEAVAKMLGHLQTTRALKLKDVYVIGQSLGAHVAGFTGKSVRGGKIPAIVALDPAKPLFSVKKPNERVAVGDAEYVQVIHTDGGKLGFMDPIGTADFYPNGGKKQPGCGLDPTHLCSHNRAWELFSDSLWTTPEFLMAKQFEALKDMDPIGANQHTKLGGEPLETSRGLYYIKTTAERPFFHLPTSRNMGMIAMNQTNEGLLSPRSQ